MNEQTGSRPPRLPRSIIRRLKEYRQKYDIVRDLDEAYAAILIRRGRLKAHFWYWLQCLSAVFQYGGYAVTWKTTMIKNALKLSFRNARRNKIYAFINLSGLTVGLTCTILIMLWVRHETSYEDFHRNAGNIYLIAWERVANGQHYPSSPPPLGPRLKQELPELKQVVRIADKMKHVVKYSGRVFNEDQITAADPSILEMFTFPMILGDAAAALEEKGSIILTKAASRKYFDKKNPLGEALDIDGELFTVTGVAADIPDNSEIRFDFLMRFDELPYGNNQDRRTWNFFAVYTFVQPEPGVDLTAVNQKVTAGMERYRPWDPYKRNFYLFPLKKMHLYQLGGGGFIKYVVLFSLSAFFILMVSCINFINLSTARSAKRAREVGLRKVIGSDRGLIFKQFFGETLVFIIIAFGLSLLSVSLLLPSFNQLVQLNLAFNLMDFRLLSGLLVVLGLTTLISGSYPAVFLSSFQPVKILKSNFSSGTKSRFRQTLVVVQFSIAVLLILCALTVKNQILFMKHADLGFDKENLLSVPLTAKMAGRVEGLKKELLNHPDVLGVTSPSRFGQGGTLNWEGMNPDLAYLENEVRFRLVDYDYFDIMGADFTAGRNFSREFPGDRRGSYIINEEAARLWQLESPVGKTLSLVGRPGHIIGVIKNIHMGYKLNLRAQIYYLSRIADFDLPAELVIRVAPGGIAGAVEATRSLWGQYSGDEPFEHSFFDQTVDRLYRQEERVGLIFGYFAALAVFISCLGLFGLASFLAERKTKEIGIRRVLGASVFKLAVLLNQEFFKCVLLGVVLGWGLGWFIMRGWLASYPYRTNLGAGLFIFSALIVFLICVFTVSFQSIRAALGRPVDALRYE